MEKRKLFIQICKQNFILKMHFLRRHESSSESLFFHSEPNQLHKLNNWWFVPNILFFRPCRSVEQKHSLSKSINLVIIPIWLSRLNRATAVEYMLISFSIYYANAHFKINIQVVLYADARTTVFYGQIINVLHGSASYRFIFYLNWMA